MLRVNLRLGFIKPKRIHAVVYIVFLELAPDEFSCGRVGDVDFILPTVKIKDSVRSSGSAHKHIVVSHMPIIFAVFVYCRPHRHYQLCIHTVKLVAHSLDIGPIFRVELIVTLLCPMKIVSDNNRKRNTQLLIFSRNRKQLFLSFIAKS